MCDQWNSERFHIQLLKSASGQLQSSNFESVSVLFFTCSADVFFLVS